MFPELMAFGYSCKGVILNWKGEWLMGGKRHLVQQERRAGHALTQSCVTRSNEDANSEWTNLSECLCKNKTVRQILSRQTALLKNYTRIHWYQLIHLVFMSIWSSM